MSDAVREEVPGVFQSAPRERGEIVAKAKQSLPYTRFNPRPASGAKCLKFPRSGRRSGLDIVDSARRVVQM